MKLYRINKIAGKGGPVLKKEDILAASDKEAVERAKQSPDCPVCEVHRDGKQVGLIA